MIRDSRKIAAILAADVVDYSRLMGADEAATLAALKARRAIFEERVREFDGREFGSVGDSLMAAFQSAVNAVSCALEIQQRVATANAPLPPARRMHLRIGVNLGDVIEEKGLLFGDAVNVAARLQALAKPSGVLISGAVYDQVHLKIPARYISAGTRQVKNIEEPIRTFEVMPAEPPGFFGRVTGVFVHLASRRVLRAISAVALLTAAVALGLFWREIPVPGSDERLGTLLRPANDAPPLNSIAVLPFLNMSGDSRDDYLGNGLAEELSHRLAKIAGLRVAARTSAFALMGKDLSVDEIAKRLGVRYVVEGSVKRQADRVRVNAALVEAGSGSNRWANSYEVQSGDFFTIESDIGNQVLIALELVLGTDASSAASPRPQGNVAAYDLFLQGLSALRQPKSAKTLDTAEQLFRRALAEQPDFARAQAGLCETQVERYALERVPALVTAAEEACARARALDSSAQEVHMAVGNLRLATGDAAEAEASYRQALAIVPRSPDALIGLAAALAAGGKIAEAERAYERAIAAQQRYPAAHIAFGSFLALRGRPADAAVYFERATVLAPYNPSGFNNLGNAYLQLGEFDKAAGAFSRSLALEPRRSSYSNSATAYYYLGHQKKAAEMFRKAIELAPSDHRLWGNLADALHYDAVTDEARSAYSRAMELAEGELQINPRHAVNHAQAAYYASRLGNEDRARQYIAVALSEGDANFYVHYYVALAELGLGDKTRAIAHVRRARQLGYPESFLRAAPELAEIRRLI